MGNCCAKNGELEQFEKTLIHFKGQKYEEIKARWANRFKILLTIIGVSGILFEAKVPILKTRNFAIGVKIVFLFLDWKERTRFLKMTNSDISGDLWETTLKLIIQKLNG